MKDERAKFQKTYAGLPNAAREEVIAVIDGEPYTWKSARLEIENETKVGDKILESLVKLGILS